MTIVHIVSALSEPSPVAPSTLSFVPLIPSHSFFSLPLVTAQEFVGNLDGLPADAKERLLHMTPASYIGNASTQAKNIKKFL